MGLAQEAVTALSARTTDFDAQLNLLSMSYKVNIAELLASVGHLKAADRPMVRDAVQTLYKVGLLSPAVKAAIQLRQFDKSVTLVAGGFVTGNHLIEQPTLQLASGAILNRKNPLINRKNELSGGSSVSRKSVRDSHLWMSKQIEFYLQPDKRSFTLVYDGLQSNPLEGEIMKGHKLQHEYNIALSHRLPNIIGKTLMRTRRTTDNRKGITLDDLDGYPSGGEFRGIVIPLDMGE